MAAFTWYRLRACTGGLAKSLRIALNSVSFHSRAMECSWATAGCNSKKDKTVRDVAGNEKRYSMEGGFPFQARAGPCHRSLAVDPFGTHLRSLLHTEANLNCTNNGQWS